MGHLCLCRGCSWSLSNWSALGGDWCVQCQVTLLLCNLTVQRDVTCPFLAKFDLFFLPCNPVRYLQVVLVAEASRHGRAHPALRHTFAFVKRKSTLGSSFVLLF